jgi:hypothetical protein
VYDKRVKGRKRNASVRVKEVVGEAREAITMISRKEKVMGRSEQQIRFSTNAAEKICCNDLLFLYKMQLLFILQRRYSDKLIRNSGC